MKDVKKLIPIQHAEDLIQRLERMNTNFIQHWREELQSVADDVTEIPADQSGAGQPAGAR